MMINRNERGTTVIIVATSLLMLLGFTALAIDGGLGFDDRRGTQNAADAAALSAAWEVCNPSGIGPDQAALDTAAANGYAHSPAGFPKVEPSGTGDTRTVLITERNDGVFGQATPFAPNELTIVSQATARCFDEGVLGGYALFSETAACPLTGAPNPSPDLDATGDNITITGNVHANDDLKISGSDPNVTGEISWRDQGNVGSLDGSKYFGSPKPYPIDMDISQYEPGGDRAMSAGSDYHSFSGDVSPGDLGVVASGVLTIEEPGVYFADGDFNLNSVEIALVDDAADRGITFAATGQITIKKAGDLLGYDPIDGISGPKMLFFSTYPGSRSCNATAIKISGSNISWEGVMFAPNGAVNISASDNSTVDGSIISHKINLSGSDITLTFKDDPDASPNFRVELIR